VRDEADGACRSSSDRQQRRLEEFLSRLLTVTKHNADALYRAVAGGDRAPPRLGNQAGALCWCTEWCRTVIEFWLAIEAVRGDGPVRVRVILAGWLADPRRWCRG
jgi:hypothetical protein